MDFQEVDINNVTLNPFTTFSKEWVLITAKKGDKVNTMTAALGGIGHVWNQNVVTIYIRPQRYAKEFVDESDTFSVTVFSEEYREKLSYLGTASGRNEDKIKKAGFTVKFDGETPYFAEANQVFIAQKLYTSKLTESNFVEHSVVDKVYPQKDFHTLYIGAIRKVLIANELNCTPCQGHFELV